MIGTRVPGRGEVALRQAGAGPQPPRNPAEEVRRRPAQGGSGGRGRCPAGAPAGCSPGPAPRPDERGLTLVEVLVALVILVVAVVPLLQALGRSLTTGEQAGRESLMLYLAQGKMEQYLQWFRECTWSNPGEVDQLESRLRDDGVDLDPDDGSDPGPRPFSDHPGYTYRAELGPAWDDRQKLRRLRVEVTGPEGRQVVLTTVVW